MCWKCGKQLTIPPPVSRDQTCPACGADVRACKNCRFYAPGSHYECRETVDEPVRDKERANFCGFFSYTQKTADKAKSSIAADKAQKARDDFANLFKTP
jgi:hypothetical protein